MLFVRRFRRVTRYLAVAGAFPGWDLPFYGAVLAFGVYSLWTLGQTDSAVFAALLIAPILAGTGLLTMAREGRTDLLFGTGVTRLEVWLAALVRAVILPLTGIALSAAWWLRDGVGSGWDAALRTVIVGFLTMGLGFAFGVLQPRYLVGVLWCGTRIAFLVSAGGRGIYMQLAHPEDAGVATVGRSIVGLFGYPEILLHRAVGAWAIAGALVPTALALALSLRAFLRADFGGHRST